MRTIKLISWTALSLGIGMVSIDRVAAINAELPAEALIPAFQLIQSVSPLAMVSQFHYLSEMMQRMPPEQALGHLMLHPALLNRKKSGRDVQGAALMLLSHPEILSVERPMMERRFKSDLGIFEEVTQAFHQSDRARKALGNIRRQIDLPNVAGKSGLRQRLADLYDIGKRRPASTLAVSGGNYFLPIANVPLLRRKVSIGKEAASIAFRAPPGYKAAMGLKVHQGMAISSLMEILRWRIYTGQNQIATLNVAHAILDRIWKHPKDYLVGLSYVRYKDMGIEALSRTPEWKAQENDYLATAHQWLAGYYQAWAPAEPKVKIARFLGMQVPAVYMPSLVDFNDGKLKVNIFRASGLITNDEKEAKDTASYALSHYGKNKRGKWHWNGKSIKEIDVTYYHHSGITSTYKFNPRDILQLGKQAGSAAHAGARDYLAEDERPSARGTRLRSEDAADNPSSLSEDERSYTLGTRLRSEDAIENRSYLAEDETF